MYTAVKGGDAQLNGRRINAKNEAINKFSSVGLDSHIAWRQADWAADLMEKSRFRSLGSSAVQLGYVAKGSLVATIMSNPKLWDFAAGALICTAAGANVSNLQGEKIFPVDTENYYGQAFSVVACNKKVRSELLGIISSR